MGKLSYFVDILGELLSKSGGVILMVMQAEKSEVRSMSSDVSKHVEA